MHVQHCDVTYDITALFNDVTLINKMMHFGHATSEVRSQKMPKTAINDVGNAATVHPECRVFC